MAMRALYRKVATPDTHPDRYLGAYTIGYILRTARNWAGPIGTFHLTVKSGVLPHGGRTSGVGAIAACADFPLRETEAQQWEATVTNYVPTRDLRVLLLPNE